MSKKHSDKLYKLVKSLSTAEKRYFKVIANKKGDASNKYIVLFNAIDAQDSFDDMALMKLVYKGEVIKSRKYSELKGYLFDVILKTLQSYDERSSVFNKISNIMSNVDVLFKRGHMQLCKDELRKAKKLALEYEDFTTLYEILKWEKWIAHTMIDVDFLQSELERIAAEECGYVEQLNLLSQYRNLFLELYLKIKSGGKVADVQHIITNKLLQEENFKSHRTHVICYRAKALLAYIQKDEEAFRSHSRELIRIMESKPHFLKVEISEYISALHNYCVSCSSRREYDELYIANEKMKTIVPLNMDDKIKIHRQYKQIFFSWCIKTGEFEKARESLKAHFKTIGTFKTKIFDDHQFYFHYAYIHFGCGDYDTALYYLNNWLNLPHTIDNPNLQMLSRVFNLILHYELGNTILLESLIKSTYRFLKKGNHLHEMERAFLSFINSLTKAQGKKATLACFQKFKKQLLLISNNSEARISSFDLMAWVDSKLLNMDFAEIVKNNLHKQRQHAA
jgi:hypothetical protein